MYNGLPLEYKTQPCHAKALHSTFIKTSPPKMKIPQKKNLIIFTSATIQFLWANFFLALLLLGCASKASNPLQEPERFAEIYTKVLLANEVEPDFSAPLANDASARAVRADSVLRVLGIDRQQFEAAIKYFGEHPERWQEVYTHVVKILEAHTKPDSMAEYGGEKRGE
jgi:hypothetical protein